MTSATRPVPDVRSKRFWDAAAEGKLLIQRDPRTGDHQWYPRGHCLGDPLIEPEWVEASGRGTLVSFSVIHRGLGKSETPPIYAIVELEEGPWIGTNLLDVDPAAVEIGMPVAVTFEDLGDGMRLAQFKPAGDPADRDR
ncbi:MAG: OB-fold domain-containing protein [Actinobacteria bacterium]|nr:OB-fold domain-containing protein [Actinomycetota bacterium]